MSEEIEGVVVDELVYLEKFIGEPLPENLFERITIKNGVVINVEQFEVKEVN